MVSVMSTTNATNLVKKKIRGRHFIGLIFFNFMLLVPSGHACIDLLTQCDEAHLWGRLRQIKKVKRAKAESGPQFSADKTINWNIETNSPLCIALHPRKLCRK